MASYAERMHEMAENGRERPATVKGPGRPRDPSVEKAILRATIQRFASDGYSRITIGDIASDAGVTRPTVYRRWANKHDLVVDALDFNFQEERERDPLGSLEELPPVEALKRALRYATPFGSTGRGMSLIGNVLTEVAHNPGLLELVRRHAVAPRVQPLVDTLHHLREEGVLRPGVDPQVVADMMIGSFYSSYIRTGDRDARLPDRVVDTLWPLMEGTACRNSQVGAVCGQRETHTKG
ncbi:TetR/AcrR family transcriptional regulator [Streptomyces cyaneus]|uniref:TetR/AcrR family transcriptional regulator n=1 Tax=Streptomyces cyaneus TaxID=1904 RepID=UPI000FF8902C|nr:TetR/AcrR family transcriptional regulator [Streptomyces cyaneus]